jgi:uncharacterized membrane protein YbhN (UPF0104 family)
LGIALPLLLVWRLGTAPFLAGLRGLDPGLLVLGVLIGAVVTISCAWRWRLVARAVGIPLSLRAATAACYRAQFLNTVLPGGVLGDVDRGLRHGARVLDRARALRAVVWERFAGQAVQVGVTLVLLAFLPSPVGTVARTLLAGAVVVLVVGAVVAGLVGRRGRLRAEAAAVLGRRTLPGVVGSSLVATTGHVATFVVAARAVGIGASTAVLVPLALLVLVAMAVPVGLGGWGPREGAAAWAFAAAGLDVGQGVAAAVVFGVLSLAAGLPGLVLLVGGRVTADRPWRPAPAAGEVASRG